MEKFMGTQHHSFTGRVMNFGKHGRWIMLEGPVPCTNFCFAFIHYTLITLWKRFFCLVSQSVVTRLGSKQQLCFVHGQAWPKRRTKTYHKELCRPSKPLPFVKYWNIKLYFQWTILKSENLLTGARFSKAPERFRARKTIFRSSVSKNGEVYTPETSCVKRASLHL